VVEQAVRLPEPVAIDREQGEQTSRSLTTIEQSFAGVLGWAVPVASRLAKPFVAETFEILLGLGKPGRFLRATA
jgi:hypothetical protein